MPEGSRGHTPGSPHYAAGMAPTAQQHAPDEEGLPSPARPRLPVARLAAVLVAVVVAGVAVLVVGRNTETEVTPATGAGTGIDAARFPRGALAGEPAPEITVSFFDGSGFALSEHLSDDGRPLVVNLWASWCTPCRREIPEFSQVAEANPDVAFIGVAVEDARGPAEAFAAEVGASYPLGIDEDLTIKNGYPFIGLPVTYMIDAAGVVTRQVQGQMDGPTLQAFIDHDFGP